MAYTEIEEQIRDIRERIVALGRHL